MVVDFLCQLLRRVNEIICCFKVLHDIGRSYSCYNITGLKQIEASESRELFIHPRNFLM